MAADSTLYRPFTLCRRLSSGESVVVVYRCFELVGQQLFVVQSADYVRPPLADEQLRMFESQFWQLLCESAPEDRKEEGKRAYPSVQEAIEAFDADFAGDLQFHDTSGPGPIQGDFAAELSLYGVREGGRRGPTPPDKWGCLLGVEGKYFDCRVLLNGKPLAPGVRRSVWVSLLDPEGSRGLFVPGRTFDIFDGSIVGEGTVVEAAALSGQDG